MTPLPLRVLALAVAIGGFAAVHASYLVAAAYQLVPWCNPYWDSCSSISATGRHVPAAWVFKAGLIPVWFVGIAFWQQVAQQLGNTRPMRTVLACGAAACLCLIAYAVALGVPGDYYRGVRHAGAVLGFTLTFMAQLLLARYLQQRQWPPALALLRVLVAVLLLGLGSVLFDAVAPQRYDRAEDAFEWWLMLGLLLWFVVFARGVARHPLVP